MKSVVILQSSYIPWKGYFDLIRDADEFIFYDDVQFTKQDWRTRNRIKTVGGVKWLTVPVGSSIARRVCDVSISDHRWQGKHWKTIEQSYSKSPYFSIYAPMFEQFYLKDRWLNLSELNKRFTRLVSCDLLGLTTKFTESTSYNATERKQDRLLELLIEAGATRYISGPAGKNYIDPARFADAGIQLVWKDYSGYPEYPQQFPPFEHGVSIVDLLFNVGPQAPWYIWGWRGRNAP